MLKLKTMEMKMMIKNQVLLKKNQDHVHGHGEYTIRMITTS